jgi:ribosome-associated protein
MDDTLQNSNLQTKALELGKFLEDHRGADVVVMDMRALNFWTDYFIIATVTSNTHLLGLERHIKDFIREKGMEILYRSRKPENNAERSSAEWHLLDLGGIVVHLMTAGPRSFYELERLWGAAPLIYQTSGSKGQGEGIHGFPSSKTAGF